MLTFMAVRYAKTHTKTLPDLLQFVILIVISALYEYSGILHNFLTYINSNLGHGLALQIQQGPIG